MKARAYTLANVVDYRVERRLADVHTAIPARVLAYDATKQKVDVQPLVMVTYTDEDDQPVTVQLPVVTEVPVMFPGAGGYRITFPIKAGDQDGDTVLLVFAEASIDVWLANGGTVDPRDDRRFHLTDGIALVGLRDFAHALASARSDAMTLGDDAGLQLHIDGSKVQIGTNVAADLDAVALATATRNAINDLRTFVASHTHGAGAMTYVNGAGVTTPVAGVSGSPTSTPPSVPGLGSAVVEVKK